MDPQELLKNILSSIYNHDREVVYQLRDLADWIEKGGIIPNLNKTRDGGYSAGVELPDVEFLPVCVICCKSIQLGESESNGCHTHCYDEMIKEAAPKDSIGNFIDSNTQPSNVVISRTHLGGRCWGCGTPIGEGFEFCTGCWNDREDMGLN